MSVKIDGEKVIISELQPKEYEIVSSEQNFDGLVELFGYGHLISQLN
jgi:hypothetical protein